MKVIIAEKPSVARDIALIVGAKERKDGYMDGNGYAVTWGFGHLVGLAMPEAYGYEGFRRENLPIFPERFQLVPRQIKDGRQYKDDPGGQTACRYQRAVRQMRIHHLRHRCREEGGTHLPLHLPLPELCEALFPAVDQQPDRQGNPARHGEPERRQGVRQPLPQCQGTQRSRLARRHQCLPSLVPLPPDGAYSPSAGCRHPP